MARYKIDLTGIASRENIRDYVEEKTYKVFHDLRQMIVTSGTGIWQSPLSNLFFPLPESTVHIKQFSLLYKAENAVLPRSEFSAQVVGVKDGWYVQPSGLAPAFSQTKPFPEKEEPIFNAWSSVYKIDLLTAPFSVLEGGANRPAYLTIAIKRDGTGTSFIRICGIEVIWNI